MGLELLDRGMLDWGEYVVAQMALTKLQRLNVIGMIKNLWRSLDASKYLGKLQTSYVEADRDWVALEFDDMRGNHYQMVCEGW